MNKSFLQYIMDSFKILFANKILLFAGLLEVLFIGVMLIFLLGGAFSGAMGGLFSLVFLMGTMALIASFMLGGKIQMIKKVYSPDDREPVNIGDYVEGMRGFGLKIFGGSLFLIISVLIVTVPLILMLANMGSLFLVIVVFVGVFGVLAFISLWDTILVVDQTHVADAYGKSISFVKKNFWVVLGLNLFVWLTTTGDLLDPGGMMGSGQEVGVSAVLDLSILYQGMINIFGPLGWVMVLPIALVFSVIANMVFVDLYMDRRDLPRN